MPVLKLIAAFCAANGVILIRSFGDVLPREITWNIAFWLILGIANVVAAMKLLFLSDDIELERQEERC
jgi:hypothetical protein